MNTQFTALAAATLAVPGFALQIQEDKPHDKDYGHKTGQMTSKGEYAELSDVLGSTLHLQSALAIEGDDRNGETAELKELIINVDTGAIEWAVVEANGRSVVVPATKISCSTTMEDGDKEKRFTLQIDRAKLDTLPEFDLGQARDRGLDQSLVVVESHWAAVGTPTGRTAQGDDGRTGGVGTTEASARRTPTVLVAGTTFMTLPGRYVAASDIDDVDVYARNEEFGSIDKLIIDPNQHKIAFAIVSHGGVLGIGEDKYLVPFTALSTGQPQDDDDKKVMCIDMPADAVAVEPARYEEPEEGVVSSTNAESAKRVFSGVMSKRGTKGAGDKRMEKRSGGSEEGHSDRSGGDQRSGG